MKTVGIKELKNNLSAYLREVRSGTRVLVSDRSRVVAELREPGGVYETSGSTDPILAEWVESRAVQVPRRGKQPLEASPVSLRAGTSSKLLDLDRGGAE